MITKEITIVGKQATLAYCFATEVGYKYLSDQDITDFFYEAAAAVKSNRMPDTHKTLLLICASITSFYESKGEKAPVTDKDIMYCASPEELADALRAITDLRAQFYRVPAGEPEGNQGSDTKKNA